MLKTNLIYKYIYKYNKMQQLLNLKDDQIMVIPIYKKVERKFVHDFLDKNYNMINKKSFKCEFFNAELIMYLGKCELCKNKLKIKHYENDMSEYDQSYCNVCDESDQHSFDNLHAIYHNNIIAFGKFLNKKDNKKDNTKDNAKDNKKYDNDYIDNDINKNYLNKILSKKIYIIDAPQKKLKHKLLEKYINKEIKFALIEKNNTYLSKNLLPKDIIDIIKSYI